VRGILVDGMLGGAALCVGVAVYLFLGGAWTWLYAGAVLFVGGLVEARFGQGDEQPEQAADQ
jgi:hypothetical protein